MLACAVDVWMETASSVLAKVFIANGYIVMFLKRQWINMHLLMSSSGRLSIQQCTVLLIQWLKSHMNYQVLGSCGTWIVVCGIIVTSWKAGACIALLLLLNPIKICRKV